MNEVGVQMNIGGDKMHIKHSISDFENEVYQKLLEAQAEASSNPRRLSHEEVFDPLRKRLPVM